MKRIVIVGSTGSGKSTLAEQLASVFNIPYVELDALFWGPNWQPVDDEIFLGHVIDAIQSDTWAVAGNYRRVRDMIWSKADTVIWLDYFMIINLWRLFHRTIRRSWFQHDLWGTGNTESWRAQFMSKDSLFLWLLDSYARRKQEYPAMFADPQYSHLTIIHLRSPFETTRWLNRIKRAYES